MVCVKPLLLLQIGALDLKIEKECPFTSQFEVAQLQTVGFSYYSPLVETKKNGTTMNRYQSTWYLKMNSFTMFLTQSLHCAVKKRR